MGADEAPGSETLVIDDVSGCRGLRRLAHAGKPQFYSIQYVAATVEVPGTLPHK
jgi:hypothetical protein